MKVAIGGVHVPICMYICMIVCAYLCSFSHVATAQTQGPPDTPFPKNVLSTNAAVVIAQPNAGNGNIKQLWSTNLYWFLGVCQCGSLIAFCVANINGGIAEVYINAAGSCTALQNGYQDPGTLRQAAITFAPNFGSTPQGPLRYPVMLEQSGMRLGSGFFTTHFSITDGGQLQWYNPGAGAMRPLCAYFYFQYVNGGQFCCNQCYSPNAGTQTLGFIGQFTPKVFIPVGVQYNFTPGSNSPVKTIVQSIRNNDPTNSISYSRTIQTQTTTQIQITNTNSLSLTTGLQYQFTDTESISEEITAGINIPDLVSTGTKTTTSSTFQTQFQASTTVASTFQNSAQLTNTTQVTVTDQFSFTILPNTTFVLYTTSTTYFLKSNISAYYACCFPAEGFCNQLPNAGQFSLQTTQTVEEFGVDVLHN